MIKSVLPVILFFHFFQVCSQVVINEVMVKPAGGDLDPVFQSMYNSTPTYGSEYVEIYNASSCNSVDISCWSIGGMDGGTNGGAFSFPPGTVIPPLGFITIGGPNTTNITFNLNLAANSARLWRSNASRWHLPNGDGWLALYDATGTAVDAVYWTFASNDPTKLNTDATFTTGALQRIATCGGGGLATASTIPGIEYIPQASVTGQSYERTTDGGATWAVASATPNACNGICATSSSFALNATIVQPNCGNNNGSISFAPSPSGTYFYTWPFPTTGQAASVSNLSPGSYLITITDLSGCSKDTLITLANVPCGNFCDPTGNLVIYSNYDGGILTINVDQNIPNLKVGICTYEPIQVSFTGPFVGNITQVIYAGMNSNQNNNNCGLGNFTTSVTGVPAGIVTISPPMNPPQVGYTPAHGNGSGPWGGGMLGVAGLCDTTINAGGGNTPDEVVYYFLNALGGTLLFHQTQYACWTNQTLNVSSGGNCCIEPAVSNPCPNINVSSSNIVNVSCFGQNTGSATVNASGGTGPYNYTWTPGNLSGGTQSNLAVGTYTVNITDANNCPGSTTLNISQPTALTATATSTPSACGSGTGTATVTASGGIGSYTYFWSPSGGSSATASNLVPGNYTVTVTDNNNCTTTATANVSSLNGPTVIIQNSNNVTCFGLSNGSATAAVSGGTAPYSYAWSPSGGSLATASGLLAGTYTVSVTDVDGCIGSASVTITAPNAIEITETIIDSDCASNNGQISVVASGGSGPYTYAWQPISSSSSTVNGLAAGTYTVTVTDAQNCASTETYVVDVQGTIALNVSPSSATIFEGESVVLTASGGISYTWSPSNGLSCDDCAVTTASPSSSTIYTVTATDALGCQGEADVLITVIPNCGEVFVPTVLSPNGAQQDDNRMACVYGNCIQSMNYSIYNRWGEKVFETQDPSNCWDGTYKGKPMNPGVFVYKLQATLITGQDIEQSGNITLLK
jgi:gliding motility-associated-like protein